MSQTCINTGLPVYDPLVKRIRASIKSGKFVPGQLVGSETRMARDSGLCRESVRRAIDELIDEGLVERRPGKGIYVREPHVATRVIEILVPDMGRDPWVRIIRGAQSVGVDHGIHLRVYDAHQYGDLDTTLKVLENLPNTVPDGAIMGSICHPRFSELVFKLKLAGYPFVLIGEHWREIEVPTVSADNHAGGYAVGSELIRRGHRRIAYIGPMVDPTARRRLEGLRDALGDAGVAFDRSLVADLDLDNPFTTWEKPVDQCVRGLMNRPDPPTAIFCCTDGVAADCYRTIKSLGLSIPGDVSLFGYDDEPLCRYLDPQLSSVRQPTEKMGRGAMEMLLERMKKSQPPIEHCVLPVTVVPRDSITETRP